jgi:hypothetical protein
MGLWIEETAAIMLAMDFNQKIAELADEADTGRLVIDPSLAAAISRHPAAQDQRFAQFDINAGIGDQGVHRMIVGYLERGRSTALIAARADLRAIGPLPGREAEGAEEDGLAGAGFASQRAQASFKAGVERINENNVSNG